MTKNKTLEKEGLPIGRASRTKLYFFSRQIQTQMFHKTKAFSTKLALFKTTFEVMVLIILPNMGFLLTKHDGAYQILSIRQVLIYEMPYIFTTWFVPHGRAMILLI